MGLSDSYEHGVVRGVVRYAREQTHWSLYGAGWMFRGLGNIDSWEGDGIIARVESRKQAQLLAGTGLPVVDVAGAYLLPELHPVTNDDFNTGRRAGIYAATGGFSRFAFCGVADVSWSHVRFAGFQEAVGAPIPVFEQPLTWWERPEEYGQLAVWIRSLPKPAALFACNDTAGIKVTALCRRLGIAVPQEIAVLGVDNEDILCELSDPPLSSIPLDCESIGYRAAAELRRLIEKRRTLRGRHSAKDRLRDIASPFPVIEPLPIVERTSTQTIPTLDTVVRRAAEFVRDRAGTKLLVSEVAAAAAVSRRTLELRFRAVTGRTVHAEILRVRMQHAAKLLRETNLPVRAVARQSGISTPQRFYVQFRRAEGCTPDEYRRRYRR